MIVSILLLVLGLALVIKGADWFVDGASSLAKRYNISDLTIGLTIVAFGTSAPELVVNTFASLQNHQEMVFGNIIGSNNFNLFIILGISGLIIPLTVQSSTVWKEIPLSLLAAALVFVLCNDAFVGGGFMLSRIDGVILLFFFAVFLFYVYKQLKAEAAIVEAEKPTAQRPASNFKVWGYIVMGLTCLLIGGRLAVDNAVEMATELGISEKIIGLTILAVGTSLPELATSVVAAMKKKSDIAIGNIIGSNIFNIFFILASSALIKPVKFDTVFNTDLYILGAGTVFLFLAMFTGKRKKLDRWEAAILLVAYSTYMVYLVVREM